MKRKPTLAQLKKRPALWLWNCHNTSVLKVSHPNEHVEFFYPDKERWSRSYSTLEGLLRSRDVQFIGWL